MWMENKAGILQTIMMNDPHPGTWVEYHVYVAPLTVNQIPQYPYSM